MQVALQPVGINSSGLLDELPGFRVAHFKPSKPISMGALATHHIRDEDVADYPPSSAFRLPLGTTHIIGHNIDFDWTAIGKPEVKRICTLAMCRALWPDTDSHSLGAMMYLLDREHARERLVGAHSAATDVANCIAVLRKVMAKIAPLVCETVDDLWELSEKMRIPTRLSFGKHKGMLIRDVPQSYKNWYMGTPDCDQYVVRAMKEQR